MGEEIAEMVVETEGVETGDIVADDLRKGVADQASMEEAEDLGQDRFL